MTTLLNLLPALSVPLFLGAVIAWDRLREPHRDPRRPFAVVNRRTYRDAQRRLERLLDMGEVVKALVLTMSMCGWLRQEVHVGRRSRRVWCAAELERLELRIEQWRAEAAPR